ncbi:TetR/AcrR family transcriptional regulator [Pseudonocardia sichuanensis]
METISTPGNARSRRTRQALLAATRQILEEEGFEALTMAAIAERAGVTRRSAYLHFASRAEVVDALFAYVAETEGLQDSVERVWVAPDAVAALREWSRHFSEYHLRVLPVDRAVARVHRRDEDAAAHRARAGAAKHANCRRLADWLDREGRLAQPWTVDTAADMINALTTSDVIEGLMVDRGWPRQQFADHFALLLETTFVSERGAF